MFGTDFLLSFYNFDLSWLLLLGAYWTEPQHAEVLPVVALAEDLALLFPI
jgi:hypothetical protein